MIWNHRLCVVMSIDDYLHWGQIEEGWVCPKCSREALPFWDVSSQTRLLTPPVEAPLLVTRLFGTSSTISDTNSIPLSVSPSTPSFTIFTFNARSLLWKLDELRAVCSNHHYDIIGVTETWLSPDIPGPVATLRLVRPWLYQFLREKNGVAWILTWLASQNFLSECFTITWDV